MTPGSATTAVSGIGNRDFLNAVWYRRRVTVPAQWEGLRPLLREKIVEAKLRWTRARSSRGPRRAPDLRQGSG